MQLIAAIIVQIYIVGIYILNIKKKRSEETQQNSYIFIQRYYVLIKKYIDKQLLNKQKIMHASFLRGLKSFNTVFIYGGIYTGKQGHFYEFFLFLKRTDAY